MTVIRPNSIAGINSITVQTGQALNVHDASGNLIRSLTNESGISTFSGINIGTAATIFANGNITAGIVTASAADLQTGPLNVGTAATISANGNATFAGIVTATTLDVSGNQTVSGTIQVAGNSNFGAASASPSPSALTVKMATNKHIGFSPSQSEVGDVPALVAFQDNGSLASMGFRGSDVRFAAGSAERLRITSDGELVVGMTDGGGAAEDARLQVRGDTYAKAKIQVLGTHNDDNPVGLTLAKSRSSGNTILGDNDDIGQIDFASNDGNGFHNVGRIMVSHDGSGNGNDDLPSMMRFYTTANAGVTLSERLRIASNGDLLYASSDRNYASWYKTPTNSSSNSATSSTEDLIFGTAVIANTDVYNTTNGRYTAPVDGLYHIRFNGLIDDNAGGAGMQVLMRKNGSTYGAQIAYQSISSKNDGIYNQMSGSGIMYMSAGDYATIYATSGMHTSNECNYIVYLIRGEIS